MVWVCYCKTCKETIAWGDNPQSLKTLIHGTNEFRTVEAKDEKGEPIFEGQRKVMTVEPITHECDVFELSELPDVAPTIEDKDIVKPADMPTERFEQYKEAQKEISKIDQIKLIIDTECQELMK